MNTLLETELRKQSEEAGYICRDIQEGKLWCTKKDGAACTYEVHDDNTVLFTVQCCPGGYILKQGEKTVQVPVDLLEHICKTVEESAVIHEAKQTTQLLQSIRDKYTTVKDQTMKDILNKEDIRHILELSKIILNPAFDSEIGGHLIFNVATEFILLDHGTQNIMEFVGIQHRVIGILRGILTAIGQEKVSRFQKDDVWRNVFALERSLTALKQPCIKEINGEDCREEYIEYGFERHKYYSEYVIMKNKQIVKMAKSLHDFIDKVDQQNAHAAEQDCPGCVKAQQQEEQS